MPFYAVRLISWKAALACAAIMALGACERTAQQTPSGTGPATSDAAASELRWARAALDRNPQIEVLASDAESGVFTIRDRQSGEVQVVKLNEIAAAPASRFAARPSAPESSTGSSGQSPVRSDDATAAGEQSAAQAQETPDDRSSARMSAATPASSTEDDAADYTIDRSDGRIRVSGPGVSIVSSGAPPATDAGARMQRRTDEPIICEGRRMLHLDDRDMFVDGDAITVREGCELFLTNSRIVASGTAVVVRNGAVHVSNSHIEGAEGSFDADADSKMYVRGSTFEGLSRRDELAMVQDQGGNRWR